MSCSAINPLTGEKIPIYLDSNEDFGEKSAENKSFLSAKLAIPSLDENYRGFSIENKLRFKEIYNKKLDKLENSAEVMNTLYLLFNYVINFIYFER